MNDYVVKNGDTLYGIGKQLGISVYDLKRINNLTSDNLIVGQVLKTDFDNNYTYYVVKKGDSLYAIANAYNVSVDEIKTLNNLTNNDLAIGQQLKIPVEDDQLSTSVYVLYTVKSGDSLYSIAKRYNTTVDNLIKSNGLTSSNLSIGDILKVPDTVKDIDNEMPVYVTYVVKSGDSLYSIAKKYSVTVDSIIKDNNLSSNVLSVGQKLKIPYEQINEIECLGESFSNLDNYTTYVVKKGDSLYSIAKKLGVSVSEIKNKNNLSSNLLNIGQVLKI